MKPFPTQIQENHLLPQLLLVEGKLFSLKNVPIDTAGLTRAGRNSGIQTTSGKLGLESTLDLSSRSTGGEFALNRLGLGDKGSLSGLSLSGSTTLLS